VFSGSDRLDSGIATGSNKIGAHALLALINYCSYIDRHLSTVEQPMLGESWSEFWAHEPLFLLEYIP